MWNGQNATACLDIAEYVVDEKHSTNAQYFSVK